MSFCKGEKWNVIIFHLESISSSCYYHNLPMLKNIESIREKSVYFSNYFSTATSTIMTVADLLLGDQYAFETSKNLEDFNLESTEKSLLKKLEEGGYVARAFYTPALTVGVDLKDFPIVFGDITYSNDFNYDYKDFCHQIRKTINNKCPFALYIDDSVTHVSYRDNNRNIAKKWHEKYLKSLKNLDDTVANILSWLKETAKERNTILVFVGDHGDSYWNHGLFEGYTHAIPPYPDVIQTPLFIYIPGKGPMILSDLIGTPDLNDIICSILNGGLKIPERKYVFSRNLYINQIFASDCLHKGYSITDGNFMLVLDKDGLQMFSLIGGYNNCRNLLDFFYYKHNTLKRANYLQNIHNEHARYNLKELLDEVEETFPVLLFALKNEMISLCKYTNINVPYQNWMKKIHYCYHYNRYSRCHGRWFYMWENAKEKLKKKKIIRMIWNAVR